MLNIALQIECLASGSVAVGSPVIFDNVVFTDGNITYSPATGIITLNEAGCYIIDWWVAARAATTANGVVFAITTSQGDFLEGDTPNRSDELFGLGIINVLAPPVTMSLINTSTGSVRWLPNCPSRQPCGWCGMTPESGLQGLQVPRDSKVLRVDRAGWTRWTDRAARASGREDPPFCGSIYNI